MVKDGNIYPTINWPKTIFTSTCAKSKKSKRHKQRIFALVGTSCQFTVAVVKGVKAIKHNLLGPRKRWPRRTA